MDVLESRNMNIVALHGSRIPEMLGSFHLDDHNVQEWSDSTAPGWKHRAREEVGKWVDPNQQADIKFQRREDSKQSDQSRERQRTEVIQGNAPDATFQIVRSQRQFHDTDQNSGRISTVSTSYQMSTSRGVRSTRKTTSNKTTTKTVTVSGGRTDDFETLKMSFQPLDTSTQRERINVSRSGTMGVRRPPTRRHTPAAILSSSPEELPGDPIMDDTNTSNGISEEPEVTFPDYKSPDSPAGISIVGYKNISPKIRVGFPVEIQLELQSKLRYSNGDDQSNTTTTNGVHIQEADDDEEGDESKAEVVHVEDDLKTFTSTTTNNESTTRVTSSSSSVGGKTSTLLDSNVFVSPLIPPNNSQSPPIPPTKSSSVFSNNHRKNESTKPTMEHPADLSRQGNPESADSSSFPAGAPKRQEHQKTEDFDFNHRRKSYGSEFQENPHGSDEEDEDSSKLPEESTFIEDMTSSPLSRHINNFHSTSNIYAKASNNGSNMSNSTRNMTNSTSNITNGNWHHERPGNRSNFPRLSPSSLSRSWDLIQSVANAQQRRDANKKLFSSSSNLDTLNYNNNNYSKSSHNQYSSKLPQKSVVILNPFEETEDPEDILDIPDPLIQNSVSSHHDYTLDSLELFPESLKKFSNSFNTNNNNNTKNNIKNRPMASLANKGMDRSSSHGFSPPDVIHHNIAREELINKKADVKSTKQQHLLKMLDETPDLLNKMSFKNYFPPTNSADLMELEKRNGKTTTSTSQRNHKSHEGVDDEDTHPELTYNHDEYQRNLDYLNESLSRLLNEGKDGKLKQNGSSGGGMNNNAHNNNNIQQRNHHNHSNSGGNYSFGKSESRPVEKTLRGDQLLLLQGLKKNEEDLVEDMTLSSGKNHQDGKPVQVSQTWISSTFDHPKPSQLARDNDVTTSISATTDPPFPGNPPPNNKRGGGKKVEFCKTEVHFTPESGKFNIVETDENKPSTVHLYRRKKNKEKRNHNSSGTTTTASSEEMANNSTKKLERVLISEKNQDKQQHPHGVGEEKKSQRKLHNLSSHTSHGKGLSGGSSSSASDVVGGKSSIGANGNDHHNLLEGLELLHKTTNKSHRKSALVDKVGVVDGKKNSLLFFHPTWTEQDAKPEELGVDEETVTPTTTTANIPPSSTSSSSTTTPATNTYLSPSSTNATNHNHLLHEARDHLMGLNTRDDDHEDDEDKYGENNHSSLGSNESFLSSLPPPTPPMLHGRQVSDHLYDDDEEEEEEEGQLLPKISKSLNTTKNKISPSQNLSSSHANHPSHENNNLSSLSSNNRRSMSELLGELGLDGEDGDDCREDMLISNGGGGGSQFGELKIQRFLKQLKKGSSSSSSSSLLANSPTNDIYLLEPGGGIVMDGRSQQGQGDDQSIPLRFDNVYENGSFVPLATRRSLIEMNNRNRKRGGSHQAPANHCHLLSDNSSTTTSNYSLPNSDRDSKGGGGGGDYHQPLKFTMEATVDTTGAKPQITTVDLRYAFDKNNSYFNEPAKRRNFKIGGNNKCQGNEEEDEEPPYDLIIPPVRPEVRSLPPFNKNGRASIASPLQGDTSKSPVGEPLLQNHPYNNHSKPPLPILPSQFSSYEKTGAALRERFHAKNPQNNPHPAGSLASRVNEISGKMKATNTSLKSPGLEQYPESLYTPSKSIVIIGGDDEDEDGDLRNEEHPNLHEDHNGSLLKHEDVSEDMLSSEPILSMDHTWKGPAHFDYQPPSNGSSAGSNKGAPVMRSMTFPKSSRPEPEWVTKAKSRESRVTDWNLVGKQYGSSRKAEPPWMAELSRFKSKPPPSPTSNRPHDHHVGPPRAPPSYGYPWEQKTGVVREIPVARIQSPTDSETLMEADMGTERTHGSITITELTDDSPVPERTPTPPPVVIKPSLPIRKAGAGPVISKKMTQHESPTTTVGHSLTDSNRDSDSILVKPPQLSSEEPSTTTTTKGQSKESHGSGLYSKTNKSNNRDNMNKHPDDSILIEEEAPLDKKLLAPLTESTRRSPSRKPLQSSSNVNKTANNRSLSNGKGNTHSGLPPPRPPKPPQRVSSLTTKSHPVSGLSSERKSPATNGHHTSNSNSNNNRHAHNKFRNDSDVDDSAVLTTRHTNNPPIHNHPLVKVAKMPIANNKTMATKSPSPEAKSTTPKNKAKHQVVTSETKLECKSKLMDSPKDTDSGQHHGHPDRSNQQRPLPKVPSPRTVAAASPHRKR